MCALSLQFPIYPVRNWLWDDAVIKGGCAAYTTCSSIGVYASVEKKFFPSVEIFYVMLFNSNE